MANIISSITVSGSDNSLNDKLIDHIFIFYKDNNIPTIFVENANDKDNIVADKDLAVVNWRKNNGKVS